MSTNVQIGRVISKLLIARTTRGVPVVLIEGWISFKKPRMGAKPAKFSLNTLVMGPTHFIDKLAYQNEEFKARRLSAKYLVNDPSGRSISKALEYEADVENSTGSVLTRIWRYLLILLFERPKFVELYDTGRLTLVYAAFARLTGRRLVFFLRGMELWGNERGRKVSPWRMWGLKVSLKLAKLIIVKELNILEDLKRLRWVPQSKIRFLGNAVPVVKGKSARWEERPIDVIFLNTIKPFRNVPILLQALEQAFCWKVDLKVLIAGFSVFENEIRGRFKEEENKVLQMMDRMEMGERIELRGFVNDGRSLLAKSKVFILPADIVFPNFALLEAMSLGCVPIVGDGEGAKNIVDHESSGLVVSRTAQAISHALIKVLSDSHVWQQYSLNAKAKIEKNFSISQWADHLLSIRREVFSDE